MNLDVNDFMNDLFGEENVVNIDVSKERKKQQLQQLQKMTLDEKIEYSKMKIKEFVDVCGGTDKVFVSFSGGKDSCVLLHLVRSMYSDDEIVGVFFNTGLEYPEILNHVRTYENIEWVKPRKTVTQVWNEYGVPAVSKETSNYIDDIRNSGSEKLRAKRLNYRNSYSLSKKWIHFTDEEFFEHDVSNKCCHYFKKLPSKDYIKKSGRHAIVATMSGESSLRLNSWIKHSCNMFTDDVKQSRPMSVWNEQDVWDYIERFNIPLCELYYRGHDRTGCFLCPYGANLDDRRLGTNRFELLKEQHPKQYNSLEKLGIRDVLLNMQVPIRNDEKYMNDLDHKKEEIKQWYEMVEADIKEHGTDSKYYRYHKYFDL